MGSIPEVMEAGVSLESIAHQIQELTKNVSTFPQNNGHPQPSLSVGGPADFPRDSPELAEARGKLIEQTQLLRDLVMGPSDYIRHITNSYVDVGCINWVLHFSIASHVPVDQPISYVALARSADVPVSQLRQVLRYANTIHLFAEPSPGVVTHTSVSRLLRDSPPVIDYVGHCAEFQSGITAKMVEATKRFKGSEEPNETAFNLAFDTKVPMFGWMGQHQEVAQRFKRLMVGMSKSEKYNPRFLGECYDWESLGEGKVVDIGGSSGHCSMVIAKSAPKLKLVVQDLPHVIAANVTALPEDFREQITFMGHDFFAPQPVQDADVYLFSQIFHDWSDAYCVKILRNVLPAMKKGAKIVIRDQVVPPPGTLEKWVEKEMRMVDIFMMNNFNAKEREPADWEALFAAADPRLKISKMIKPPTSVFTIMEIELGDDANGAAEVPNRIDSAISVMSGLDATELREYTNGTAPLTDGTIGIELHEALNEATPVGDEAKGIEPHVDGNEAIPVANEVNATELLKDAKEAIPVANGVNSVEQHEDVNEAIPAASGINGTELKQDATATTPAANEVGGTELQQVGKGPTSAANEVEGVELQQNANRPASEMTNGHD